MNQTGNQAFKFTMAQWWGLVGVKKVRIVAEQMGTSMMYLQLIRTGKKRPSKYFAHRLIEVAKQVTPDFQPDIGLILEAKKEATTEAV